MAYDGPRSTLLLGGARSGKSSRALALAEESSLSPIFVATATAGDQEMAERIARHRQERSHRWRTIEEPLRLVETLGSVSSEGRVVVVDCLTSWLANLMFAERPWEPEVARLADCATRSAGPVMFVANEVGWGIVPDTPLGRQFRDAQGRLNQSMAAACDRVELVVAGLSLRLKG